MRLPGKFVALDPVEHPPRRLRFVVELLQDRLRSRADVGLPFSGTVALELEGCNRLRWIIDSLNAMKMIAAMTAG